MRLRSILSQLSSDSAAPLTLSGRVLCESKSLWRNCSTAVLRQKPQTITHSKHFVAQCLCMQIYDQFCLFGGWWGGWGAGGLKDNIQAQFGGLLLFTLCSRFFFLTASLSKASTPNTPCWTLGCDRGINWRTEISGMELPFILCSLFCTLTHMRTRTHMTL